MGFVYLPMGDFMSLKVKKFLDDYDNKQVRRNFEVALSRFFKSVYDKKVSDNLDEIAEKYFIEKRDHEEDIETFLKSLKF